MKTDIDFNRTLLRPSNREGFNQLAFHSALIGLTAVCLFLSWSSWLYLPCAFLFGTSLVFLFAPLHEAIHMTAFKSKVVNVWLAKICGFVLLLPPEYFRAFHFAHHRYTQDPARDPELLTAKPNSWLGYIVHISGIPYWCAQLRMLVTLSLFGFAPDFIPITKQGKIIRETRVYLALFSMLFIAELLVFRGLISKYWFFPLILGQPVLRVFLLAEHTACPKVPNMLVNTRTTLTSWFVRRLSWNMSFHVEHHSAPAVPFYNLPKLHNEAVRGTGKVTRSYGMAHHEIRRNFPDN